LQCAEAELKKQKLDVVRAPFGYYKEFALKCKGHPLAELSREITAEEVKSGERESKEKAKYDEKVKLKGKDRYLILTYEGKEFEITDYKFKSEDENFRMLVEKEALKKGLEGGREPKFIRYVNKFQIEAEPMSDKGHMRYGPSGTLIFNLIADYSEKIAHSLGIPVYVVKGTNMFNLREKAVKEHADLFGDRLYSLEVDKERFVMRYAACHQQFAMIKDWNISYKNMPFGALEIADSYRLEQPGELLLAFRTRRMDMPDLHIFCRDLNEAREWFEKTHNKIYEEVYNLGRDYEILFNFSSKRHYEQNKDWVTNLLRKKKKNALLHFYPEGINYYWTFNIEYMIIDELKRPREIATVQIDTGNAHRFNIRYIDKNGKESYPIILHTALLGTIGRYIFALLDTIVQRENKGKKAELPFWLSPTQVRIIPVSEKYVDEAIKLGKEFNDEQIRTDVDDRQLHVQKRILEAEQDWVPYIIVLGEKELQSKTLAVRISERTKVWKDKEGRKEAVSSLVEGKTKEQLIKELKEKQGDKPFRQLPLPMLLGKRPKFIG
jgi:threonyl-tRNA synthetase